MDGRPLQACMAANGQRMDTTAPSPTELIVAMVHVTTYTAACRTHGDAATFAALERYYELVHGAVAEAGGRVVKFMGDAALVTFPYRAAPAAATALAAVQKEATAWWQEFDPECRVQVKATVGPVMVGELGVPGAGQLDVIGDTVNRLVKIAATSDLWFTPDLRELLE